MMTLHQLWQSLRTLLRSTIEIRLVGPHTPQTPSETEDMELTVRFPLATVRRLDIIRQQTNSPSRKSVISDALKTWETLSEELADGSVFWVTRKNGERLPVEFISHEPTVKPTDTTHVNHLKLIVNNDTQMGDIE